ncbi:MAG: hypothetical protein SFH39_00090 [Candidatus Magnetobacterium sp. LHC-1]
MKKEDVDAVFELFKCNATYGFMQEMFDLFQLCSNYKGFHGIYFEKEDGPSGEETISYTIVGDIGEGELT